VSQNDPLGGAERRPRALFAMSPDVLPRLFDAATRERLAEVADFEPGPAAADFTEPQAAAALAGTEVLVTCWGCPPLDEAVLAAAPRLRAVVHAAGSVKHHVTPAVWRRGIAVSSAAWANALPVAEYTVAAVLFAGKRVLQVREEYRRRRGPYDWYADHPGAGNYRRTVGVVGASLIGRRVLELLRPYDLTTLVYDPYADDGELRALGATPAGLDDLCAVADVVTVHAPQLPSTRHLISRARLASMRDGATLVNTARGSLVDQEALTEELVAGRLHAVVDVTEPEFLPAGSPLYELPNVLLTPHIAGSLAGELPRLGRAAADELARYAAGLPFAHPVRAESLGHRA
jgi:phosphoglycerate dehydrogenase-like enzyme